MSNPRDSAHNYKEEDVATGCIPFHPAPIPTWDFQLRKEALRAISPHYSPKLQRDLISPLYHAAKARRIPMTRLASSLLRDALARLREDADREGCAVSEALPAADPGAKEN